MIHFQTMGRWLLRLLLFPIRHVLVPVAGLIHEGVVATAEDDAFWFGVCGFLFIKSMIWLVTYHAR